MPKPDWRKTFGDDYQVPKTIQAAMTDSSDKNDACPKFELQLGHFILTVFTDHPDPKLRELPCRFEACVLYTDGTRELDNLNLLKTDDERELVQLISMIKEAQQ